MNLENADSALRRAAIEILHGKQELLVLDRDGEQRFLNSELLEHGRLRQGWGVPGLDLRRKSLFQDNFVVAMRRYWNVASEDVRDDLRESLDRNDTRALFSLLSVFYREAAGHAIDSVADRTRVRFEPFLDQFL